MVRAVFCVLLAVGVAACDASTANRVALPNGFATPANTSVVGTAVPVLAGPGPESDAQFAPGWFALLRVDARPREAYAAVRQSAKRRGVTLPPVAVACHALDCCNKQNVAYYDDNRCMGEGLASDGRTYVSVAPTSCTGGECKRNGYVVVSFRSTRVQRAPTPTLEDPSTRLTSDEASGTRLLAGFDMCNGSGSAIREVLTDPDKYWEGLRAAANSSSTARTRFQGRSVRLRFTSSFGDDVSYAMTSGRGLTHPVVVIQHCG